MRYAWIVLVISALTDFGIVVSAGIVSAMMATGSTVMPSRPVVLLNILLGAGAFLRTVQQALKSTPETAAALKGDASVVSTSTVSKTP